MTTPVEVTTRYATSVDTLTDAFAFVMEHVDTVGDEPTVHIKPFWTIHEDGSTVTAFEVVVSGMVHAH